MKIGKNKFVSLIYELRCCNKNGSIVEIVTAEEPLTFVYGRGELLDEFESNLKGLKKGDDFEFQIIADNAYGHFSEDAVVDLPKEIFEQAGVNLKEILFIGNEVPMKDKDGNEYTGIIVKLKKSSVVVDFNHPLAGEDLYFKGEVIEVRTPTAEELEDY